MTYKLLILFSLFLLSKELQAQEITINDSITYNKWKFIDSTGFNPDYGFKKEVNQIGFVVKQHIPILVQEDSIQSHWTFKIVQDTLWFNEGEPIALPSDYEKILWRKNETNY